MKRKLLFFIAVIVGVMIVVAPFSSAFAAEPEESKITVMTQNLYLGADIFKVLEAAANPCTIPGVVYDVYQTMLETNFWARAEAIADEIADAKPQVVCLNEVESFLKYTAVIDVIDFYEILNAALEARGMYYEAFTVTNADVTMPMMHMMVPGDCTTYDPSTYAIVQMVDHDVILVRKGHDAEMAFSGNYSLNFGGSIGGLEVEFTRGYIAVDVNVKGDVYRVVNTHLEVQDGEDSVFRYIQAIQMGELLSILSSETYETANPIILVGDLNSADDSQPYDDDGPYPYWDSPYMQLVDAGYADTWLLQSKYDEGYTSGFDEYVSDPTAELTSRIDHIFLYPEDLTVKVSSEVVGDELSDMVPNPDFPGTYLWPSDHAGVVSKIKFLE